MFARWIIDVTTQTLLTLSQLAIAIGLVIAAVGGYGAYYFKEVQEMQIRDTQKEEGRKTREELHPLVFGPVNWGAQAGYSVAVKDQDGQYRQGLWGFPTVTNEIFRPSKAPQTLFATVTVTNRNSVAAKILSAGVTVRHLAKAKVDIGMGEMVGGVRNRRYTCTIRGAGVGDFDGRLVDADADYISVDAGGIETLVICVYSDVSGLLTVSPRVAYLLVDKQCSISSNDSLEVAFFDERPPNYVPPDEGVDGAEDAKYPGPDK